MEREASAERAFGAHERAALEVRSLTRLSWRPPSAGPGLGLVRAGLVAALTLAAAPARADVTAFLGANTTPANRQVRGGAVGVGLLVVAFEFEYAFTTEDPTSNAPSMKTGSGNLLLQTPVALYGVQPYFTTGGGLYNESLGTQSDTGFAVNTGGGVKISLAGPLRVRVDYRVMKLGSGALYSPAHRIYVGLNLKL